MRRVLVLLLPLALLAAGCGGGGGGKTAQSHTVLEVSKIFSDAGLQFTGIVTGNQYVTGQTPFLPMSLTGEVVWVFDTDANANKALKQVPLKNWGQGPQHIDRQQFGNVIVVASGFSGAPKAKLDKALSALK
jgi:hypothetical protein